MKLQFLLAGTQITRAHTTVTRGTKAIDSRRRSDQEHCQWGGRYRNRRPVQQGKRAGYGGHRRSGGRRQQQLLDRPEAALPVTSDLCGLRGGRGG